MKKIVYNVCYGGFSLSVLAQQMYAKLKGINLFFYQQIKYQYKDGIDEYKRIDDIKNTNNLFVYSFIKNLGEIITNLPSEYSGYKYSRLDNRKDPDLVKVVEELGEKADGSCAKLKIIELEDNVLWRIDEYDGYETVMTQTDYDWQL